MSAPFAAWLRAAADRAGAPDVSDVKELLVAHGCHCTDTQVAAWLEGSQEPTVQKARTLITALNKTLPGVDVWEQYARWKEGKSFFDAPTSDNSRDDVSLGELVGEDDRLPPPLTD
ncbi:MAG: hypothetical protein ACR2LG_08585 [Actinomycetota bacterium]|nr:hypothetical protein [Actinomycetota bacterium]